MTISAQRVIDYYVWHLKDIPAQAMLRTTKLLTYKQCLYYRENKLHRDGIEYAYHTPILKVVP